MIKKVLSLSVITALTFSASAQTAFTLRGKVKDTARNGEKITLSWFNGEKKMYKQAVVNNGQFVIEGTVKDPAKASLSLSPNKKDRELNPWKWSFKSEFFIEGGDITVDGFPSDKEVIKVPGKSQKDYLALQAKLAPFVKKEQKSYDDMIKAAIAKDSVNREKFKQLNDYTKVQMDSVELAFMKANPASHVSLDILREVVSAKSLAEEKEKMYALYSKLSAPLKETVVGKEMGEQIQKAFQLSAGKPAEDFVLNDTLGNPVRLSDFRGKYVLLDFWASWCIPCRYENPNVLKAYEHYKEKNFTVLSVSLEQPDDYKAWVAAIKKDGLTWPQVATLKQEEADQMRKLYAIQTIPMNYLIDPKGNIIAVHLRGEALEKKLAEIL